MGSLKSTKRSKWYMCFRPQVEDYPFKPISCLGKSGKESMLPHNIFVTLSGGGNNMDSSSDGEDRPSKKSKSRRSFSRAFKAVLFQSPLAKKKRSRKSEQETSSRSSSCKLSSKLNKFFNSFRDKKTSSSYKESLDQCGLRTDSRRSSLFSSSTQAGLSSLSSSSASSIASNSRSASQRKRSCSIDLKQLNQKPSKKTYGYYNSNVGLYFLLICLVGLVFWGKAFAVFCTSTCLFLIPCWFKRVADQSAVNNNVDAIDIDSDEYKKKVIMDGLLERNRNTTTRIYSP